MYYSEIVLGEPCVRPIHFNKYEFFIQFETGECDIVVVPPASGLSTANMLEDAKAVSGDTAYELLRGVISLDWPVDLSSGDWAGISSFNMYYYNFKGVKQHVILK
jgi:hypothetical protein